MRTSISDLLIRYQAHVARPKQHNSFKSIDPTKTVRGYNLPCEASYFHFNHRVPLPLLFPPVFTVNDECLGEELVYDRSRFLERHEAPWLERQKACRARRMSFTRRMNPVSKKKLQPSKTKATHKTCEQDEGNANDYSHHEQENSGAQRHPKEGHTSATCNACNTRSINDDTCDTCCTSVNDCNTCNVCEY